MTLEVFEDEYCSSHHKSFCFQFGRLDVSEDNYCSSHDKLLYPVSKNDVSAVFFVSYRQHRLTSWFSFLPLFQARMLSDICMNHFDNMLN